MEDKDKIPEDIQEAAKAFMKYPEDQYDAEDWMEHDAYIRGRMDERAKQQATTVDVEQLAEDYVIKEFKKLQEIRIKEGDKPLSENSNVLELIRHNKKPAFIAGYQQGVKQSIWTDADLYEAWKTGVIASGKFAQWLENYKKSRS